MPIFYQTLNLPLTDVSLPLGDLQDSTNGIFGDSLSDSLYFKFEGFLDTVTLTEDIFVIPTATNVAFQQDFGSMEDASNPVEISFSQRLRLATLAGITLPQSYEFTTLPVPRAPLIDQEVPYQIFDKNEIPYFERVDYLTIGDGEFSTIVENEMLMDLDSVLIRMKNKDGSIIAESFYENIPAGETRTSNSDLQGKHFQDSIFVVISAIMAGTDGAPLVIPANSDPYMNLTVNVSLNEIESFTGKPEPIETRTAQKLPESKRRKISLFLSAFALSYLTAVDNDRRPPNRGGKSGFMKTASLADNVFLISLVCIITMSPAFSMAAAKSTRKINCIFFIYFLRIKVRSSSLKRPFLIPQSNLRKTLQQLWI